MNKKTRELVLNKFGGRCSYCGCDLTDKRWHVDHAEPVERYYKKVVEGGLFSKETGDKINPEDIRRCKIEFKDIEQRLTKYKITHGKPENHHFDNMMPACISCNINKGMLNIEGFRAYISRFPASINASNPMYKIAIKYGLIQETGNPVIFYFEIYEQSKIAINQ